MEVGFFRAGCVACVREGSAASALDCSYRSAEQTGAGGGGPGREGGSGLSWLGYRRRQRKEAVPLARPPPREGGDGRAVGHPGWPQPRSLPGQIPDDGACLPPSRATPCTVPACCMPRSNTTAYHCLMRPGQRRLLARRTAKPPSSETDRSRRRPPGLPLPHVHPRTDPDRLLRYLLSLVPAKLQLHVAAPVLVPSTVIPRKGDESWVRDSTRHCPPCEFGLS